MFTLFTTRAWTGWLLSDTGCARPCFLQSLLRPLSKNGRGLFEPKGKDMAKKKYKGIDLFCGIGGFRLAMEDNNVECVFSSDNDKFAQETYQANFGEIPEVI